MDLKQESDVYLLFLLLCLPPRKGRKGMDHMGRGGGGGGRSFLNHDLLPHCALGLAGGGRREAESQSAGGD